MMTHRTLEFLCYPHCLTPLPARPFQDRLQESVLACGPIRRASLDFMYSIGVLQHLSAPKDGFVSLTRMLKPGAPIFVWVYKRGRGQQIAIFTAMRAVSTRLPLALVNISALLLAIGQWALWLAPYRLLKSIGADALAANAPFTHYARHPFRVLHTDWVDGLSVPLMNYYKPEEIAEWDREAGATRVAINREWEGRAISCAPQP
jgi:hypothetical protein